MHYTLEQLYGDGPISSIYLTELRISSAGSQQSSGNLFALYVVLAN